MDFKDYFIVPSKDANISEKINAIKSNNINFINLVKEINDLKNGKIGEVPVKNDAPQFVSSFPLKKEDKNDDIQFGLIYDEVSMLDIENLTEEEIETKIKSIIDVNDIYFNSTVNKIKVKLYEEIMIYSKMLNRNLTRDELLEISKFISQLRIKINVLSSLEQEKEIVESTTSNNNLFFLVTDSGNISVLESLRKNVPKEYYPQFKELFLDLKNGKFKGLKKLSGVPYFEVKEFKIRITFAMLSGGNIIILDAFMKKDDKNNYIEKMFHIRANQFLKQKKEYLEKHKEENFKLLHEGYLAQVLTLLDERVIEEVQNESRTV